MTEIKWAAGECEITCLAWQSSETLARKLFKKYSLEFFSEKHQTKLFEMKPHCSRFDSRAYARKNLMEDMNCAHVKKCSVKLFLASLTKQDWLQILQCFPIFSSLANAKNSTGHKILGFNDQLN